MVDFKVNPVQSIDVYSLRKVLNTSQLTDYEKIKFVKQNTREIKAVLKTKLSAEEYNMIVDNRPLQSFKPIKNSFTKRGDKILLSQALNTDTKNVDTCIKELTEAMKGRGDLSEFSKDDIKSMRTYVYRHGTKDQLMTFLNYELTSSKNLAKSIHNNLEYHMGGIANYFIRPIHRMDDTTMMNIYKIIDNNIAQAQLNGQLSELEATKLSQWALQRVCTIQHNQKMINAIRLSNKLDPI